MSHKTEDDRIRNFYRAFIIQALKDLGNFDDRGNVMLWSKGSQFDDACVFVGWDSDWVRSIFKRVNELEESNRKSIIRDCAKLLERARYGK